MNHLSEEILNLYLDMELPPGQRTWVESHLAGCTFCRAALKELETVFDSLAEWTPAPLPFDISQQVMSRLELTPGKPRPNRSLAWTGLAFQALLSIFLGVLVYPWIAGWGLVGLGLGGLDFTPLWQTLGGLGNWLGALPDVLSAAEDLLPSFSPGNIGPAGWAGPVLALGLGWLVLNRLLLKGLSQAPNQHLKGDS